jgi:acylphosphatase
VSGPPGPARLRAVVRGRVQGVGFRASVQHEGGRLGLGGWVRNLSDGGVELEAEGDGHALEQLLAFLKRGPRSARVDSVITEWLAPAGLSRPFSVLKTV